MFCPNCGTQNDDNGVKCQKCGFNLKGAAAPKFKGTMLMMNSPLAQAPKPAAPPGGAAGPAPWPKAMAKATMIGVAPPSPGAVSPPGAGKSPAGPPVTGGVGMPSGPPAGPPASFPRPVPPAAQGASPAQVNPFGGTMLMGAVPPAASAPAETAAPAESAAQVPGDRTVTSEGAPPPNMAVPSKLESTTPSVAPPAPFAAAIPTQAEMAAIGTANTAPPPPGFPGGPQEPAFPKPEFGVPAPAAGAIAPASSFGAGEVAIQGGPMAPPFAVQTGTPKVRSIGKVVGLGIVTFGIYWIIALLGALSDFNSIRGKNDINPILFLIPILGLLELLKLPKKVEETRSAVGVSNPVAPNLVLYILFPQIFFIADLNEIVEAHTKRTSIS